MIYNRVTYAFTFDSGFPVVRISLKDIQAKIYTHTKLFTVVVFVLAKEKK